MDALANRVAALDERHRAPPVQAGSGRCASSRDRVQPAAHLRPEVAPAAEWKQLFNGKDLTGWKVKIKGYELGDNHGNTFRVENGVLKVGYDAYGGAFRNRFGHLFYEKPFSHYVLAVEYRFTGEQAKGGPDWAFRNSGIMVHSQSPQSIKKDQDFPICIEVQLLGGKDTGERPTANVCTPGTYIEMKGRLDVVVDPARLVIPPEPIVMKDAEIKAFCTGKYDVTFPMMSKISVKGKDIDPLYKWLTSKDENGVIDAPVSWNFQKFMIDENGNLVGVVSPSENPQSEKIVNWIKG